MDFINDPGLVLHLPLYELEGASIKSRDTYGQLCTVTGALWKPNGHYFDGSDDYIALATDAAVPVIFQGMGNSDNYTLLAWIKTTSGSGGDGSWWANAVILELRRRASAGST